MSSKRVLVAGAALDTGNLGVSALSYSVVSNLLKKDPQINIKVFDHGKSVRKGALKVADLGVCDLMGANNSKRFFESSTYSNMRFLARTLPFLSAEASAIRDADAILDISAGDSFTDLYLGKRFMSVMYPKLIALETKTPLVLLPQTYGPFDNAKYRSQAERIVRSAHMAFARDRYSYEYLQELLGDDYDPDKHQQAVDVAFILPATSAADLIARNIMPAREADEVYGFNVSGLIYNQPEKARSQYKITLDYAQVVEKTIEHILENSDGEMWLVPHVLAPEGHYESDIDACRKVKAKMKPELAKRVKVVSGDYDQCDIKGVIAQCNWFCGTRMHSTIASLSSMVPTAAIAYSGKFKGVFESAGQVQASYEARTDSTDGMIANLLQSWAQREGTVEQLKTSIPLVRQRSEQQFDEILASISR